MQRCPSEEPPAVQQSNAAEAERGGGEQAKDIPGQAKALPLLIC